MKALLICPSQRPGVSLFSENRLQEAARLHQSATQLRGGAGGLEAI